MTIWEGEERQGPSSNYLKNICNEYHAMPETRHSDKARRERESKQKTQMQCKLQTWQKSEVVLYCVVGFAFALWGAMAIHNNRVSLAWRVAVIDY
jgi:cell division protein FtsL